MFTLLGLFGAKRVVVEIWGRDAYKEAFLVFSCVLLAAFVVIGGLVLWKDYRKRDD